MIGIRGFFTQRHKETEDTIFTMKIDLSLPGGTTNGFKIPFTFNTFPVISGQTSFPLEIDWGDGNTDIITSYNQAETEHIYSTSGIYDISIIGTLDDRSFEFISSPYREKLIEVGGTLDITNATNMFRDCSNLSQCNIISLDNLIYGTQMFQDNNLTSWTIDLPNLINGNGMFQRNNLTSWTIDLPNLTTANGMFHNNSLTSWTIDLPNLTSGSHMFYGNSLTSWTIDLPELVDGQQMFISNSLTSWNASLPNLTSGSSMFSGNNLTSWDTELPELVNGWQMFANNNLTSWTVGLPNLATIGSSQMFINNTINTIDYSNLLISMEANNPNNNAAFHGGNSKYNSSAVSARANLVSRGWIIIDGGLV